MSKSLATKLSEIYTAVAYVQKTGKHAMGYTYVTEADLADKVRTELAARNVVIIPRVVQHDMTMLPDKLGKDGKLYPNSMPVLSTVTMEFDIHDGDSNDKLTVRTMGMGQDMGDKAIYKAQTGATKYMMMKLFLIPTGDDPETEPDKLSPRDALQRKLDSMGAVGLLPKLTAKADERKGQEGNVRMGPANAHDISPAACEVILDAIQNMTLAQAEAYADAHVESCKAASAKGESPRAAKTDESRTVRNELADLIADKAARVGSTAAVVWGAMWATHSKAAAPKISTLELESAEEWLNFLKDHDDDMVKKLIGVPV